MFLSLVVGSEGEAPGIHAAEPVEAGKPQEREVEPRTLLVRLGQRLSMTDPFSERFEQSLAPTELTETLNAFFDLHYYPHFEVVSRRPRHTLLTYEKHLRHTLGPLAWSQLTPVALNAWLRRQMKLGLENTTINKHIDMLNRLLRTSRDWEVIPDGVRAPRYLRRLPTGDYRQRFMSSEEIQRLLVACGEINHPFLQLFIRFLLLTGARKGEARTARWRDIDTGAAVWRVPRSKNDRSRRIMLSAAAMAVLEETRDRARSLELPVDPPSFVFTNPRTMTCYGSFHIAYYKARDMAGLADVRIHDLRHTYASLLINNGVTLYEVQELLGHCSPAMTQRYAHLLPNRLHQRTEIVGRIVDSKIT
ncbi:tyrosine-type recombinase/integrase [Rhodobacterales bacterium HKCCE3408]|nr:tyrosine-type recombinase/integrase [Rhodobacterales bacterium HKCCE3408]